MSSATRTATARSSCRARRRAARRPGPTWKRRSRASSASTARSTAASRAASPSISAAPWRSCRAARSTSARCATSRPLMGTPQPFQILKMDRARGNIVVSRRAVLEETRAEQRSELIQGLKEGMILDGVVKNITDYGAFVDLGGVDGLLHVTDIAWRRINHPSEALQIGQQVKVQVIRFNSGHPAHQPRHEAARGRSVGRRRRQISAGREIHRPRHQHHRLRRLRGAGAGRRRPGARLRNVLDQEERPSRQDRLHQPGSRRHGARRRQRANAGFRSASSRSSAIRGSSSSTSIRSARRSRAKSATSPSSACSSACRRDIDGMVHMSDLSWDEPGELAMAKYEKGQIVKAKVLDVDVEKERISLGIKQLRDDPAAVGARHASTRATSSPAWSARSRPTASRSRSTTS